MVARVGSLGSPPPAFPPHQLGKESRTRDLLGSLPGHPGKPGPDRLPALGRATRGGGGNRLFRPLHPGRELPSPPRRQQRNLGQRNADALTSSCTDSLTGRSGDNGGGSQPLLTVTLEGSHLSSDGEPGETGLAVLSGPRVGPETLDVLLCTGKVEINLVTSDGRLLGVGEAFSYLSPRLRRHVLARDGGCSVDGCA